MVRKGAWVRIHKIILQPQERTGKLPDDTKKVPLELWTKGFLQEDAQLGAEVEIRSVNGRRETGTLVEVEPYYEHDFGMCVPELLQIDQQVRNLVFAEKEASAHV